MARPLSPVFDRGLFGVELALFAAIFWADAAGFIPFSKTPFLFLVALGSMWLRRASWRSLGLALPARWGRIALIGLAAGAAMWAFEFFILQNLLLRITGELPDLHEFDDLVGDFTLLMIYLALNLVLAAFGEEFVWRGFALTRMAGVLGGGALAWIAALLVVNAGFGLAHLYQGVSGVVETAWAGLLLGALYLATGRNLLAPMIAHFVSNTIDFTLIYLGLYPGVRG
jgi:membrane protease YdiL (CAAX protease family)